MPDDKPSDDDQNVLWHQSGVAPSGEPFVQLLRGTAIVAQLSTAQARDHARAILEAAEAAEQDAFMMAFAREEIGLPFNEAGKILIGLREYRARTTGKSQGPTRPTDWVMPPADKMPHYPGFDKPKRPGDSDDFTKKDPRK